MFGACYFAETYFCGLPVATPTNTPAVPKGLPGTVSPANP